MGKLVPRWYQADACDAIMASLATAANVNPVAAIVTGGGKALLVAMLMEAINLRWPGARVMNLAPSMELVKQNTDEAVGYLPAALVSRIGVYCAGLRMKDRLSQLLFATPQSVARQAKRFGKIDFVIVDEAHAFDINAKTGKRIVDELTKNNPAVRFIALTATDFRMKGLKVVPLTQCGLFNAKVYDLTSGRNYNRLVREGYIVPVVAPTIRFPQVDTEGVKTKGGDFDETELARRAMAVTQESVAVALDAAPDRKHFMWFGVNIEHAQMIQRALVAAGESSVLIHGDLEHGERVEGIDAYLAKEHRHIVSVAMLTTGFNAKFVDALVVLRPTRSLVLWKQIVGRGFRPYQGKENVLLLDGGGNIMRHGPLNADVDNGDSRVGLWRCTGDVVHTPLKAGKPQAMREQSSIRFPVNGPQDEPDLRLVLGLMDEDSEPCGFLNDAEHMACRQCGRLRQGFMALRQKREKTERSIFGEGDSYELHDEDAIVLKDEACKETRQLVVNDMAVTPEGNSVLNFEFATDFGPYALRLDFDRNSADPKFFAMSRKFFESATGRKLPSEAYRVILQRELIPKPVDITLTRFEDNRVFLTEIRFVSNETLRAFRYNPSY